jgi:hypothetical protein
MWFVKVKGCKMNIEPPPSSFRMDKRNTFLEKSAEEAWEQAWRQRRRWAPARGQASDDPAHPGSRGTRTRSGATIGSARVLARWQRRGRQRWAPERGQAAVDWTQCRRPRLDPLRFGRGGKQRQGGACRWGGSEIGEGPTSRLRAQVSGNYEEVSRERRKRCRGPHLWLWQRPRRRWGKFLWISLPFYLFYRWSLR